MGKWVLTAISFVLEKGMATHSSTLAWKIPWTEEPGRLQSMGSRRVGHDWLTSLSLFTFMHWRRKWQPAPVFLAWRIPGTAELGGLLSMGSHRVGHDWSDLAAAVLFKGDLFPSDILYELDKKLIDLFIFLLIHEYSIIPVRYFRIMLKSRSAPLHF